MSKKSYMEDAYCPFCDKEVPVIFTDGGHERDSSGDKQECSVCGALNIGWGDTWYKDDEERNTYHMGPLKDKDVSA